MALARRNTKNCVNNPKGNGDDNASGGTDNGGSDGAGNNGDGTSGGNSGGGSGNGFLDWVPADSVFHDSSEW